jgi:DNA-binding response OmpR family regulator
MRLLVIEDEPKIAAALKAGLEQAAFAVDLAHDADSGEQKALSGPYDLVVLDRMLPSSAGSSGFSGARDGLEIVKKMRSAKSTTPVLILTAKDAVSDRVSGLNVGADDYLVKPFAFTELLARVRALLRRPDSAPATRLQHADLTLNPTTFAVARAGKPIDLSAKEFALLEYLLRNAGQTVTKDAIIQHVWNFDADVLPNTVEVFIGYLRNKIDKPFSTGRHKRTPLIVTVRGFGYRLGEPNV